MPTTCMHQSLVPIQFNAVLVWARVSSVMHAFLLLARVHMLPKFSSMGPRSQISRRACMHAPTHTPIEALFTWHLYPCKKDTLSD
jgi:hypothetical protein